MKRLGTQEVSPSQVVFLRFFFATIILLPWLFTHKSSLKTSRISLHIVRGALLFVAILLWCKGLNSSKLAVATTINFTIPIFTMFLAAEFLKEYCNTFKIGAAILGFIGIIVMLNPISSDFNVFSLLLILSAFLFASLDVINKKFIPSESVINMLFYSNLFTAAFAFIPAIQSSWEPIWYLRTMASFVALGIGANLILYCLLKSFSYIEVSSVAGYRYLELLFSIVLGKFFFGEQMDIMNYLGILLIIFSSFLLSYRVAFNRRSH